IRARRRLLEHEGATTMRGATQALPRGTEGEEDYHLDRTRSKAVRRRSLRLLADLLRPMWKLFALTAVVVVIAQGARVAGPALVMLAIDHGLPAAAGGDWLVPGVIGTAYILAAIVAGVCTAAFIRLAAKVSQAVLLDLRQRVFRHTQRLSLEFHENYTSGRIIA